LTIYPGGKHRYKKDIFDLALNVAVMKTHPLSEIYFCLAPKSRVSSFASVIIVSEDKLSSPLSMPRFGFSLLSDFQPVRKRDFSVQILFPFPTNGAGQLIRLASWSCTGSCVTHPKDSSQDNCSTYHCGPYR
jgi:hypothetical protein